LNTLRKEGFARVHQQRKGEDLKTFREAKGEVVKKMSQAQGVRQRYFKFILKSSGGKVLSFQEGRRKSTEGHRELRTLEVFKLSKVTEESAKNSARSTEEVRE
jgi:hypothetical protein